MYLFSNAFRDGATIPSCYAFGDIDPDQHMVLSDNRNPDFYWSGAPEGSRSLVMICHDPDVPNSPDGVNQEGVMVDADRPRTDFFHWLLVDLDPMLDAIEEGAYSRQVMPGGKPGPESHAETRQGVNDYTGWFTGDEVMQGIYFGYDGPCPPWNDERLHRYVFSLYALDMERCPVEGAFTGQELLEAMSGHILAKASITGTYSLNPALRD